jgi:hypothetical protein
MDVAVGGDAGLVAPRAGQTDRSLSGEHWAFLASLRLSHETDSHFFVHANYAPNRLLFGAGLPDCLLAADRSASGSPLLREDSRRGPHAPD